MNASVQISSIEHSYINYSKFEKMNTSVQVSSIEHLYKKIFKAWKTERERKGYFYWTFIYKLFKVWKMNASVQVSSTENLYINH